MLRRDDKPKIVSELKDLIQGNKTIGVVDLLKLPGRQQLKIKNSLKGTAKIKMARKSLIIRALAESGKIKPEELVPFMSAGSPALIFSNENPFKLFQSIRKSRAKSAAKVGSIVQIDITIPKGPTGISPGPAISTLQKAGLKTKVEGGKIAVIDDKVVLRAGGVVTEDFVAVFNLLKIEPIEIGLELRAAWEDGTTYPKDVLDVSPEQYLAEITSAVIAGINLSMNIDYPTKENIELMIRKVFSEARGLCLEADIFEKDVIGDILAKAVREAKALESLVPAS